MENKSWEYKEGTCRYNKSNSSIERKKSRTQSSAITTKARKWEKNFLDDMRPLNGRSKRERERGNDIILLCRNVYYVPII